MQTLTTTTTILDEAETELTTQARIIGRSTAVNDYCEPLYRSWLDSLTHGQNMTTAATRLRLAAGMRFQLSIRDALIMSVVTDVDDLLGMLDCAANPHEPKCVDMLSQALTNAFNDATAMPVKSKTDAALDMLHSMTHDLDTGDEAAAYLAQTLATSAYIHWWTNQPAKAEDDALHSLTLDQSTTLSSIVLAALTHDVYPAWAS